MIGVGEKLYTFDFGEDKMIFLDSMTTQNLIIYN